MNAHYIKPFVNVFSLAYKPSVNSRKWRHSVRKKNAVIVIVSLLASRRTAEMAIWLSNNGLLHMHH